MQWPQPVGQQACATRTRTHSPASVKRRSVLRAHPSDATPRAASNLPPGDIWPATRMALGQPLEPASQANRFDVFATLRQRRSRRRVRIAHADCFSVLVHQESACAVRTLQILRLEKQCDFGCWRPIMIQEKGWVAHALSGNKVALITSAIRARASLRLNFHWRTRIRR